MNLIDRVKNMLITPKTEWQVIATETPDTGKIVMGYVLPLGLVAAVAAFIGYGVIGVNVLGFRVASTNLGLYTAIALLVQLVISVFLSAFVVDALAPSFSSEKNFGRSVQLIAYGTTPGLVAGIFYILPALGGIMGILGGIYGVYLIYIGLGPIKKTPEEKRALYVVVCILALIVIYIILGVIMREVFYSMFGLTGFGGMRINI